MVKTLNGLPSEFFQRPPCLFRCFLHIQFCLGEKLVGKTDDLFLNGFWHKVDMRQRQVLLNNLAGRQSGSRMSLTHPGMSVPSHLIQDFRAQNSMTDIRLGAKTMDARGIRQKNADIMEHSRLLSEERIGIELRMTCYDTQRLVSHILSS